MTRPRREFIGWLGASSLLAVAGAPLAAMEPVPSTPAPDGLVPVDNKWDVSWADRIGGKFRAVFDSPDISEGMALFRAAMWRDHYNEVYGTTPEEMSPVLVIRHGAIPLVMNDEYWARFRIGRNEKLKDPDTKKWYVKNPIRVADPKYPKYAAYSLEGFMASGGTVLACNLAFGDVVSRFQQEEKLSRSDARAKALEHIVPGVILQPSGVFAVLRAQQAGCAYIMAS